MWNGPIHEKEFVNEVLEHAQANRDAYGTTTRMEGMLTLAKEVSAPAKFLGSQYAY